MLVPRRVLLKAILGGLSACGLTWGRPAPAAPELAVPSTLPAETLAFEKTGMDGWTTVEGQWAVEDMPGAPSGSRVLVQRALKNQFNVILAPLGPYSDLDVSVKFKPISGREDASGGLVFRFAQGRYYVARANALEDNVRLYHVVKGDRRQFAGWNGKVASGKWHDLAVEAEGDHFQVFFDGKKVIDAHDKTFADAGKFGVWTKADSVIEFDDLTATPK